MKEIEKFSFNETDSEREVVVFSDYLDFNGSWCNTSIKSDNILIKDVCEMTYGSSSNETYGSGFRLFIVEFECDRYKLYRSML